MQTTLPTREALQSFPMGKAIQLPTRPPVLLKLPISSSLPCSSRMGSASPCRVALLVCLLSNQILLRIMVRCSRHRCLSPYSLKMPTPVRATAIPATPMAMVVILSSSPINIKLKMDTSRIIIVSLPKIELNNNKWEFIMESHKLHIWFHRVQTTVRCFLTARSRSHRYQDSRKCKAKLASNISNMA